MIHVCYVDATFAIWAKEQVNGSLHTVLHAALLAYADCWPDLTVTPDEPANVKLCAAAGAG